MPVAWPLNLPQLVDSDSFGVKKGDTLLRSDMDTGPQKVRRRFTKGIDLYSVTIAMTATELAVFESYFDIDLNGGANTFTFVNPITQVEDVFRIAGTPDYKYVGGVNWKVSMQWEKMP